MTTNKHGDASSAPVERRVSRSVVSYGAGTNSTAMLIGLHERGERPDLILFADTGGERPETYRHKEIVSQWCESVGFPSITTVAETVTLEQDCLNRNALPGLAYGFKSCSEHYKIRPQKRWLRENGIKKPWFWVGIDAGEAHRKQYEGTRYPLIEWGWARAQCVDAIHRAGLPQSGKSSCFFCPAMKKREVFQLRETHPDLLERALEIERRAQATNTTTRGLAGEKNLWAAWLEQDERQAKLFDFIEPFHEPCGCYDG